MLVLGYDIGRICNSIFLIYLGNHDKSLDNLWQSLSKDRISQLNEPVTLRFSDYNS